MNNKEQELYDKFVDVLNDKLESEPSAQDMAVVLNFLKYNGIQATRKHQGLNELATKATKLPFEDDEDDLQPLKRIK